jgi:hypothetical protein
VDAVSGYEGGIRMWDQDLVTVAPVIKDADSIPAETSAQLRHAAEQPA